MPADFDGRVALVTGGASGIGLATARLLTQRGATVVIADLNAGRAQEAATSLGCAALALDVTDAAAVEQALARLAEQHGGLDLAVNGAGMSLPGTRTGEYPLDDWHRIIDLNLNGVFHCMRHEIPLMLRRGGGAIVNVASIAGVVGIAGVPAYVASKHAVIGLTKTCALDYARSGIRVNAVAPGYVDTPLLAGRDAGALERAATLHPMGRMARPEEIAETIVFLLSPQASFTTGAVVMSDGGYTVR